MAKYTKGWSSRRSTATHHVDMEQNEGVQILANCGAKIRFTVPPTPKHKDYEICDWCQAAERRWRKK